MDGMALELSTAIPGLIIFHFLLFIDSFYFTHLVEPGAVYLTWSDKSIAW
jgi:hypothetical protein